MSESRIIPVDIAEEMKSCYIDYSMSVIVSRALPDVRDGMKPVHRRVLFGMEELGVTHNKAHKKSARIVGEVLGKYHPHGDQSVYDTMVRMAQDWSLRYPLVDGQGNFGSMDGDRAAAMRYTEARLEKISGFILNDIKKNTVDFKNNFDDSLKEPTVLPSRVPNLLINGASGIAVGMATNMLPHNLNEVVNGVKATIANPEITVDELMQHITGPDFPTGGTIHGTNGIKEAYETGRGKVVVRAKADIEITKSGREVIVITEIPYQVNKANLVMKMAKLVNEKVIEGVSDIRDESDRKGLRIVIEVKKDGMASVILSQMYKYTYLQSSYGINNIALVNGRPELLTLKEIIQAFIDFRIEIITRRTQFDLDKALNRSHILTGLLIALDYIDAVIDLIRKSKTPEEAKLRLMKGEFIDDLDKFWKQFGPLIDTQNEENKPASGEALTEKQAKAILDMRLQKLTGLERDKLKGEYDELQKLIADLRDILGDETRKAAIIIEEMDEIVDLFGDERRTDITFAAGDINIEDMIADDEVIVTISNLGYIKRTNADEYRAQGRGGRGSKGSKTRDTDFVVHMFGATNHNYLLLFTDKGQCFWLRVYEIPETSKTSFGRVIQNILPIPKGDKIKAYIKIEDLKDEEFLNNNHIIFATKEGQVKKTLVSAFSRPRSNGIRAISIKDEDQLIDAKLTSGDSIVMLANRKGRAIRFHEKNVRPMGRTASGVRGMRLDKENDEVIGMVTIDNSGVENTSILVISELGSGKRTMVEEYRETNRGGKGVKTMQVTAKTGEIVAIKAVLGDEDLMITNKSGIVIRTPLDQIRVMGRATQGVRVIRIDKDDSIADVAITPAFDEDESLEYDEDGNVIENTQQNVDNDDAQAHSDGAEDNKDTENMGAGEEDTEPDDKE